MEQIDVHIKRINMDWDKIDIAKETVKLVEEGFDVTVENIYYDSDDQDFYFKTSELNKITQLTSEELNLLAKDIAYFVGELDCEMSGIFEFEFLRVDKGYSISKVTKGEQSFIIKFAA